MPSQQQKHGVWDEISSDVPARALEELDFLARVHAHADVLLAADVLRVACARYEHLWLQLLKTLQRTGGQPPPNCPLDVALIWHSHVLSPIGYFRDCEAAISFVPPFYFPKEGDSPGGDAAIEPQGIVSPIDLTDKDKALRTMLKTLQPASRAAQPGQQHFDTAESVLAALPSKLKVDVVSAASRDAVYYYQVALPHYKEENYLTSNTKRYITFLQLHLHNAGEHLVPPLAIDLLWRAHRTLPRTYHQHTQRLLGKHLSADGAHDGCWPSVKCVAQQAATAQVYLDAAEPYFTRGGMFRGFPASRTGEEVVDASPDVPPSAVRIRFHEQRLLGTVARGRSVEAFSWALQQVRDSCCFSLTPLPKLESISKAIALDVAVLDVPMKLTVKGSCAQLSGNRISFVATSQKSFSVKDLLLADQSKLALTLVLPLGGPSGKQEMVVDLLVESLYEHLCCRIAKPEKSSCRLMGNVTAVEMVSEPQLLLPLAATIDKHADCADAVTFPLQLGTENNRVRKPPLQVQLTSTRKHMAAVVEVYSTKSWTARNSTASGIPTATAHSLNLAELPRSQFGRAGTVPALNAGAAERAFLIRCAGKDWAVLKGWWQGQKQKSDEWWEILGEDHPGGLACDLIFVGEKWPRISSSTSSTGNANRKGHGVFEFSCELEPISQWKSRLIHLHINMKAGDAHIEAGKDVGLSDLEAGLLSAALAAVATCMGVLHTWCMPCTSSVITPESPAAIIAGGLPRSALTERYMRKLPWCQPPILSSCQPSNGYICKRLSTIQACADAMGRVPRLESLLWQWYGESDVRKVEPISRVWWGGALLHPHEFPSPDWCDDAQVATMSPGGELVWPL